MHFQYYCSKTVKSCLKSSSAIFDWLIFICSMSNVNHSMLKEFKMAKKNIKWQKKQKISVPSSRILGPIVPKPQLVKLRMWHESCLATNQIFTKSDKLVS